MSLSAVLTAQNTPLIDWSTTTLNNVLLQGDKMYLKALDNGLIVLDTGVEFLSIANLPTFVSFLGSKNELSYEMCRSVKSPVQGQGKTTSPVMVTPNNENGDRPIVIESLHAQKNTVVSIEVQNNIELLVEAQNKIELPIVVERIEAQNKIDQPIVAEPIQAQNKIDLLIVVEPVEAQNKIDLPIAVEPVKTQSDTDLPFEAQNNNRIPIVIQPFEEQNNDNLPISVAPSEVENENLV